MSRLISRSAVFAAIVFSMLGMANVADAQRNRNMREVRDIVRSLNSKIDDLEYTLTRQMQSNSGDPTEVSREIRQMQDKITVFEDNLDARRENRDDVADIIESAKNVRAYFDGNPQNRGIANDWAAIENLLNRLAANYGISPKWDNNTANYPDNYPAPDYPTTRSTTALTGTYELDRTRSENVADIVADANVVGRQRQDLESKLEAPAGIALDVRGNQVVLATTNASPVSFIADGREKTETNNGRTVRLRATLSGQVLTVSSLGGETDYTITFTSADSGRKLKVSRRITTEYLRQTVFAESFYNKTDSTAGLGIDPNRNAPDGGSYSSNDPADRGNTGYPTINTSRRGEYIVPNGTVMTAFLDTDINTKASQNNDRFRMTVQSPDEFRGAVIEGYLSGVGRSGKVTGRSNVTFNFERISLRNGQTYDFAGVLQSVKDHQGKDVKVDNEGAAKSGSQTKETAKRGGIGAGIGAVIGAIAGGAKGAVIGAIIGGGAGAGSVFIQGKEDLELLKGSTITVQSSSPRNSTVSQN